MIDTGLDSSEQSLLQVIVANPGSAEAKAALVKLEIRSRKVAEQMNRRMLVLTVVLALAALGQFAASLLTVLSTRAAEVTCVCDDGAVSEALIGTVGRNR